MIDFSALAGFDWDVGNAQKNERHGVTKAVAEQAFFDPVVLIVPDMKHSTTESRFHALGISEDQRYLHITFTLRAKATLIRVISARDMSRNERKIYESQT